MHLLGRIQNLHLLLVQQSSVVSFPRSIFLCFCTSFVSKPISRGKNKVEKRNSCEKMPRKFLLRPIFTARLFGRGGEAIIGWTIFIKSDFMLSYIELVGVPCIWLDRHTPAHTRCAHTQIYGWSFSLFIPITHIHIVGVVGFPTLI